MKKKVSQQIKSPATLVIDIGGTAIKMIVLDSRALPLTQYIQVLTPRSSDIKSICSLILKVIQGFDILFDRVSVGFPGVVQNGVIITAPNMHTAWVGVDLQDTLKKIVHRPVRAINDADALGFAKVSGKGVELVITLGTGLGSALFLNGKLLPNLELGHHPFRDNKTYEQLLGKKALEQYGIAAWRKNLKAAILIWKQTFNCEKLYLGGGIQKK